MANLLEALQQQQPQMQDTTSQLATLLRAKSGKAVGAPATALSTQQEQAAVAQTAQAMQPVQQAAVTQQASQEQQSRDLEQKRQQQVTDIAQSRQANQLKAQIDTNRILQDLEQGKGKVSLDKYKAGLEQVGQNLRLNNREYIDNLQREGARARLNDKIQFEEQLNRSIFQDNKQLLEKQLGNKSILNTNDREFSIKMEQMGVQTAYDIFRNDLKSQKETATIAGAGGLVKAGIGAYGTYEEKKEAAEEKAARKKALGY